MRKESFYKIGDEVWKDNYFGRKIVAIKVESRFGFSGEEKKRVCYYIENEWDKNYKPVPNKWRESVWHCCTEDHLRHWGQLIK